MASRTQRPSHRLSAMWGIIYNEKKRQVMSTCTYFLGNAYDWAEWLAHLALTFGVKPTTRAKAKALLNEHLIKFTMTPA